MSIFLYASGEDVVFDNERIRLTIEMNFVLYHPPWRNDWGEIELEQSPPQVDDKAKLAIIEQGILTYHALRTNHSLIEYLRHLALKANSYVQTRRTKSGHLMLSAEPLPPTY